MRIHSGTNSDHCATEPIPPHPSSPSFASGTWPLCDAPGALVSTQHVGSPLHPNCIAAFQCAAALCRHDWTGRPGTSMPARATACTRHGTPARSRWLCIRGENLSRVARLPGPPQRLPRYCCQCILRVSCGIQTYRKKHSLHCPSLDPASRGACSSAAVCHRAVFSPAAARNRISQESGFVFISTTVSTHSSYHSKYTLTHRDLARAPGPVQRPRELLGVGAWGWVKP